MKLISSVFMATSLDGYYARENGDLDWLDETNTITNGDDCGYNSFFDSVDVLIMGRATYEKVLSFGIEWPYKKPVVVLSRNKINIPDALQKSVSCSSESPLELYNRFCEEGKKRLYIDGGLTIRRFLDAGLIDDITLTIIPIILGSGKHLFEKSKADVKLELIETKSYDFGFLQLSYKVKK